MTDPLEVLAKELYVAENLHAFAKMYTQGFTGFERSYFAWREKYLANAPYEALDFDSLLELKEKAIKLLRPQRESNPLTEEELKLFNNEKGE